MSGIPSTINVLGTIYTVELRDLGQDDGETCCSTRTICIDSKSPYSTQVETFYHELIHVILGHSGLDYLLDGRKEEAIAQGIGMALTYIISANNLPKVSNE